MPRFVLALAAALPLAAFSALYPAPAAADSPPPDRFTPCQGHQEGEACYQAGCTCVAVNDPSCPGGAASCLACENAGAWCGPVNYHPAGGCASAAPASAAAAGLLGLALLARRRRR
jgi:MYXO-CTERM domain-containing protein